MTSNEELSSFARFADLDKPQISVLNVCHSQHFDDSVIHGFEALGLAVQVMPMFYNLKNTHLLRMQNLYSNFVKTIEFMFLFLALVFNWQF